MARTPRELSRWSRRLAAMKRCRTADELRERYGAPDHVERHGTMGIWHYPLGVSAGTLYSIHVAVPDGSAGAPQVYMHLAPTDQADTVAPRPWWRFW